MKTIFLNSFFEITSFAELAKCNFFLQQQRCPVCIIEDSFGDRSFALIQKDSFSGNAVLAVGFSSDTELSELLVFYIPQLSSLIIGTNEFVFFISNKPELLMAIELSTPLVGLRMLDDGNILLLEEGAAYSIKKDGVLNWSHQFDLINSFELTNSILRLETYENKAFQIDVTTGAISSSSLLEK